MGEFIFSYLICIYTRHQSLPIILDLIDIVLFREQTPAYGALDTSLAPGEEITILRRQVGKLNRRVMAIESEIQQQQQRMKIIYAIAAMYMCLKTIFWFGKN